MSSPGTPSPRAPAQSRTEGVRSVVIGFARDDDAATTARIYAPYVTDAWVSFEERAPDASEMARRIEASRGTLPWLVARIADSVVGYAYASEHRVRAGYRWSVDVSVYVLPDHQRMGIARQLYGKLFTLLAAQGYVNAYAGIALPNEASEKLHRSLGFRTVGIYHHVGFTAGAWHDTLWLERALVPVASLPAPPPEPNRLDALDPATIETLLA